MLLELASNADAMTVYISRSGQSVAKKYHGFVQSYIAASLVVFVAVVVFSKVLHVAVTIFPVPSSSFWIVFFILFLVSNCRK